MFIVCFNNGNATVFDTDDFSTETLPSQQVMQYLSGGIPFLELKGNLKVARGGRYAFIFSENPSGARTVIDGYVFIQGYGKYQRISTRYGGTAKVSIKDYNVGALVKIDAVLNGCKYSTSFRFDSDLSNMLGQEQWHKE